MGWRHNVPEGMEASSAIACMSVMGFDPAVYYAGRGPIEAMAMGIELEPGQVAMRCNLVTVADGVMASYSAGNIPSAEAAELVAALQEESGRRTATRSIAGVSFRHILHRARRGRSPRHQLHRAARHHRPAGRRRVVRGGRERRWRWTLMERSKAILAGHPGEQARVARG